MSEKMAKYLIKSSGIIWLLLIAASLQAQPEYPGKGKPPFPEVQIGRHVRGEEAIGALAGRLPEVAAWYGKTPSELARLLRHDRTLWVNPSGRLLYICELEEPLESGEVAESDTTRQQVTGYSLDQTFRLHSLPGSKKVLYLDFDGAVVSGSAWNSYNGGADIVAAPFSLDSDRTTFNATELQMIQNIWKRVAEDYSPFDIDVTTEEPTPDALIRSSSNDTEYGNRVVITPTNFYPNAGGVSYVGSFDDVGEYLKISWVFSNVLANGEKYIAEACSHESGHSLGLHHMGTTSGTVYYTGQGEWAPIMGNSYYKNVTQWAKGEYAGANNTEDQLALMQKYGLAYYPDDHGNSAESATMLQGVISLSGSGFIERNTDVDMFKFLTGPGDISFNIIPAPLGPDLKILAELRDGKGNLIASSSLPNLSANLSANVTAGTYYLEISGIGSGDPLTTGYSDYASLGQYVITGIVQDPGSLRPPVAVASASPAAGEAPLAVSFSSSGSSDDGLITAYSWDFGDGSPLSADPHPVHLYQAPGTYKATLTVSDNEGLIGTSAVNVGVFRDIYVDSIVMASQSSLTAASAVATVSIKDTHGNAIAGATVNGSWSGAVQGTSTDTTADSGQVCLSSPQSVSSGTFTFTVTGVAAAGYTYNPALNRETSDSIKVSLLQTEPPSVSIISPAAGASVSGAVSVQVSAVSSLQIASVSLAVDGNLLGTDTTYPYEFTWNTAAYGNGAHLLTATARDGAGNTSSSSSTVYVNNLPDTEPPRVSIVSPQSGAILANNVTVKVDAGDNVGVVKVELYVDGKLTVSSTAAPFTMKWITNKLAKGLHMIYARAYDAAGNYSNSAAVTVQK